MTFTPVAPPAVPPFVLEAGIDLPASTLAPGRAAAAGFVLVEPLSFWGGLDAVTGTIIDRWHPQHGQSVTGKILVMTAGRGSSSGSSVLAESIRLQTGPVGIVLRSRDAIVTIGALVAAELYDIHCPVVLADAADWDRITEARQITLDADPQTASVVIAS